MAADSNFPDFSVSVDVTEGATPLPVTVSVFWNVPGGQESVVLTTLRTDY